MTSVGPLMSSQPSATSSNSPAGAMTVAEPPAAGDSGAAPQVLEQHPACCLHDLPDVLLDLILRQLGIAECARGCALANLRLHHACKALSGELDVVVDRRRLEQLVAWMRSGPQGQGLTSVSLSGAGCGQPVAHLVELPCSQLRQLALHDVKVALAGVVGSASPALTRVCMRDCYVLDGELDSLAQLPQLQHLSLQVLCRHDGEFVALPEGLLPQLPALTHLALAGVDVSDAALAHLSCLTALAELNLDPDFSVTAAALAGLKDLPRLSSLAVSGAVGITFSPAATPALAHALPLLRRLELSVVGGFAPALLRNMPKLRHLVLSGTSLVGEQPGGCVHSELLCLLAGMTHLTHLGLESSLKHHPPARPEAYAALLASPRLQHLDLTFARLPPGAWPHIFAPQRPRPALRVLKLYNVSVDRPFPTEAGNGQVHAAQGHSSSSNSRHRMTTQDVSRLTAACPRLTELVLVKSMRPGQQLGALRRLSGSLTSLHIDDMSDDTAAVLSQLVDLRELHMTDPGSTTDGGLRRLTALRRLTTLYMSGGGGATSPALTSRLGIVFIQSKAPAGAAPDVWSQLLWCCDQADEQRQRDMYQPPRWWW